MVHRVRRLHARGPLPGAGRVAERGPRDARCRASEVRRGACLREREPRRSVAPASGGRPEGRGRSIDRGAVRARRSRRRLAPAAAAAPRMRRGGAPHRLRERQQSAARARRRSSARDRRAIGARRHAARGDWPDADRSAAAVDCRRVARFAARTLAARNARVAAAASGADPARRAARRHGAAVHDVCRCDGRARLRRRAGHPRVARRSVARAADRIAPDIEHRRQDARRPGRRRSRALDRDSRGLRPARAVDARAAAASIRPTC